MTRTGAEEDAHETPGGIRTRTSLWGLKKKKWLDILSSRHPQLEGREAIEATSIHFEGRPQVKGL